MAQTLQQLSQNSTGILNSSKQPINSNNSVTGLTLPAQAKNNSGLINTNSGKSIVPAIANPSTSIGIKTKSPTDNLKTPSNTTPQPQVKKPASSGNTTEGGTQNTNGKNADGSYTSTGGAVINADGSIKTPATPPPTNPDFTGAIGGLLASKEANDALGTNAQTIANNAGKQINNLRQTAAGTEGGNLTNGSLSPIAQGRNAVINTEEGAAEQGVIGQENAALTGNAQALTAQGQTQSAQGAAGGLAQPNANIINVNPETGNPVNGQTLPQLAQAVGQVQGIQSGAAAQAATSGNIAAQNATTLGTAGTQAAGDIIKQNTTAASNMLKAASILTGLNTQIGPNMGTTGFNPTQSPVGNQTFAQYFQNANPAAAAGIKEGLSEIQNQISNVISTVSGLTPTAISNAISSVDFQDLNPKQLSDFMQYVNQYAQTNVQSIQQTINAAQSGNASGAPANPSALPSPQKAPTPEAILGTGGQLGENLLSKLFSTVSGAAGEATAGAVGGLASKILM